MLHFVSLCLLDLLLLLLLLASLILGTSSLQFLKRWLGEIISTPHFIEFVTESNDLLLLSRLDRLSSFHLHPVVEVSHHLDQLHICESIKKGLWSM